MPDLHFMAFGQCFPRFRCERQTGGQPRLPGLNEDQERVDNITDTALRAVQARYGDNTITKDQVFDYVYGILHAPDYRERFATDLAKGLPRVPLAGDFHACADAGRALSGLHLGYERCAEYPLMLESIGDGDARPEHLRLGRRAMRFKDDDKTVLELNEHARLAGIPGEAHEYQVNGRTPLEWFIDRYRVVQDTESGIVNDPNGWFEQPEDLTRLRQLGPLTDDNLLIFRDRTPKGRHYTERPGDPLTGLQDSSFGAGCFGNAKSS